MFTIKNFDPKAIGDYTAYECKSYRIRYCQQSELISNLGSSDDANIRAAEIFLDEAFRGSIDEPIRVVTVRDSGRAFIENGQGKTIDKVRSYFNSPRSFVGNPAPAHEPQTACG